MVQDLKMVVYLACIILLNISCATTHTLLIEIQKPASIKLPKEVTTVLVVNNAANQPADFLNEVTIMGKERENATINADSLNAYTCLGLCQGLKDSDLGIEILLYNKSFRKDNKALEITPLSQDTINRICEETGSDAVIVLNQILIGSILDIRGEHNLLYGSFSTRRLASFSIMLPNQERIFKKINLVDTLYWDSQTYSIDINGILSQLPIGRDAMHEAAYFGGVEMAQQISPSWIQTTRTIYSSSNSYLKQASSFANKGKWEEAVYIWEDIEKNSKNSKINRGYSASNRALFAELNDEFEEAVEWQKKAVDYLTAVSKEEENNAKEYLKTLERRAKTKESNTK